MNDLKAEKKSIEPKSISYIIEGNPIPLARCRYGNDRIWDSQKQAKFAIGLQISNQHNEQPFLVGPLKLDVIFFMPIPVKGAKSLQGRLHTYKPDLDNLLKMICDVANGIIFKDDSEISIINSSKQYAILPRTEFTITEMRV